MKSLAIGLLVAAELAACSRLDAAPLTEAVRQLATPLVDPSGQNPDRTVGLVVVVVTPTGSQVLGVGALRSGETTPPDGDTFFQIGSVSKTLTGLILAAQVESSGGTLAASTPVNSLLAADLRMPAFAAQPVTVAQLATHYGGLPAFPNNLTGPAFYPAQGYSRAQLASYLNGFTLAAPPGSIYEYSNTGFGLLAIALADRVGATSYSALLAAELTGPLGMLDTGLNEAAFVGRLGARLAQGYRSTGSALVPMAVSDMGVLEGAGEIISTPNDLTKLLRVLAGLDPFPVPGAVERAVAPRAPGPAGTMTGYGLDIYPLPGGILQWEKAGLVAGYTSYFAFRREPGTGVIVLSNRGQHQATVTLARQVLALLSPPALTVEVTAPDVMSVSFPGSAGISYEVQSSIDLITWETLTTLSNDTGNTTTLTTSIPVRSTGQFVRLRY